MPRLTLKEALQTSSPTLGRPNETDAPRQMENPAGLLAQIVLGIALTQPIPMQAVDLRLNAACFQDLVVSVPHLTAPRGVA
jgi:hypothetical protein